MFQKKIICWILFILGVSAHSFSQTFNKRFILEGVHTTATGCVVLNNSIYVTGWMSDTLEFANGLKSFVVKFDENGNQLGYKTFRDSTYLHFAATTAPIKVNNSIYFAGYTRDTTSNPNSNPTIHIFLMKVDTNLNATILTNYVDSSTQYFVPNGLTIDCNNNFYLAGINHKLKNGIPSLIGRPFILKTDSSGSVLHYNMFQIINRGLVFGIDPLFNNSQLYMTVRGDSDIYVTDPVSHIHTINYLLQLDTACNLINSINYFDSNAFSTNSTIIYNNQFYGCGAYINTRVTYWNNTGYVRAKPTFYKFNSVYQLQSKSHYGNNSQFIGFKKIKKIPGEDAFVMVGKNETFNNRVDSGGSSGILTKVDTSGNQIWLHQYRGFSYPLDIGSAQNVLNDLDFLSDGSIIACGNAVCLNNTLPIGHQSWLIRLGPDGCLDSNDCGFETGITGLDDLPPAANDWENSTNVYPNPSDQFITLSYRGTCSEKMYVEVYSALGQRMLHEEYSVAQTNKRLETAQLQNGIYFYKLYCNYREVGQGKFIVQR